MGPMKERILCRSELSVRAGEKRGEVEPKACHLLGWEYGYTYDCSKKHPYVKDTEQGYETRTCRSESATSTRVSISPSSSRLGRIARHRIPGESKGYLCAWLLLART
jgi:hypothetical protein